MNSINRTITRTHFGIYANISLDGKILVIKKSRGPYTGRYDLPGGTPESGEAEGTTLSRELMEETGCTLQSHTNSRPFETYFSDYLESDGRPGYFKHVGIVYDCTIDGNPISDLSDVDSAGAVWIPKSALTSDNTSPFLWLCLTGK